MATVKAVLFPRKTKRNTYFIKIRVSTKEKNAYHTTGIDIPEKQWDTINGRIRKSYPDADELNLRIQEMILDLNRELLRPSAPISDTSLPPKQRHSIDDVFEDRITELIQLDKHPTARRYRTARKLLNELELGHIPLKDFKKEHALALDNRLKKMDIGVSTRINYHKIVKRIFTWSVENNLLDRPPVYIKLPRNRRKEFRKVLSVDECHVLFDSLNFGDFGLSYWERKAIAAFEFSYLSNGMRFGDLFRLQWKHIHNGLLSYTTEKNLRPLTIQLSANHMKALVFMLPKPFAPISGSFKGEKPHWHSSRLWTKFEQSQKEYEAARDAAQIKGEINLPNLTVTASFPQKENKLPDAVRKKILNCIEMRDQIMRRLIDECCEQFSNEYIFEYGRNRASKSEEQFVNSKSSANTLVNRNLKSASRKLDLSNFSFHSARHSFAHHLRSHGKDILFISRALGHGNLQVTVEYLKGFSDETVTSANVPIVEALNRMY